METPKKREVFIGQSGSMGENEKMEMDESLKGVVDRVAYGLMRDKGIGRPQDIDLQSHDAASDTAEKQHIYDVLWKVVEENRQLFMAEMPGPGGDFTPVENALHRLAANKLTEMKKEEK